MVTESLVEAGAKAAQAQQVVYTAGPAYPDLWNATDPMVKDYWREIARAVLEAAERHAILTSPR